jgi:hypothetical protein
MKGAGGYERSLGYGRDPAEGSSGEGNRGQSRYSRSDSPRSATRYNAERGQPSGERRPPGRFGGGDRSESNDRTRDGGFGFGSSRGGSRASTDSSLRPIGPRRNDRFPLAPVQIVTPKTAGPVIASGLDEGLPEDEGDASGPRGRPAGTRESPRAEGEKTSRSYRDAEGGAFVISRGRDRGAPSAGASKDRGRGKDRDDMNLERIRAERERTRKVKVVDVKVEKKVFVPSSVSVGRLADIFGVKICKSYRTMRDQLTSLVNLQRTMQRLGLSEDQRRSDHREYCHFRDLTFSDD